MATTLHRPELGPVASELIDLVQSAVRGDGLPLLQVIELFGVELNPRERTYLQARGAIRIAESGAAENQGAPGSIEGALVNVKLPRRLTGRLLQRDDGFSLRFDPGWAPQLAKGPIRAEVLTLTVGASAAELEVGRRMFNLRFTW